MKKQTILSFFILFLSVICLSGCGQKAENKNDYKLPLGDVAYMTEMDFYLKNSYIQQEVTDETAEKKVDYNYVVNNTQYVITINAKIASDSKAESKWIAIEPGYYNDENNKTFVSLGNKVYFNLTKADQEFSYEFTTSADAESAVGDVVIKMYLGTSVDEEKVKDTVENKEYKSYMKSIEGCALRFTSATLENKGTHTSYDVLTETNTDGEKVTKTACQNDLYYYNTASIEHAADDGILVVTLNSKTGVWQWIVEMLGVALAWLIGVLGNKYWLGLLVFTLVLRTAAWPIYAKSTSYSTNMAKIQPEMEKIKQKYEGRTDQNSQMKQQMEMKELMKKNKVSIFGCLTPFLQMPIFIAVYQVVSRFPLTPIYMNKVDFSFAGTSFGMEYGVAESSWVLALLVGITMMGSQILSMVFQKINQKKHENFYTKQQNNKQQNKTMIIFMIIMTAMMVYFAFTNAGIAFYWVIGNLYQIGQTALSKYLQEKKEEKERLASGKVRGRE